MADLPPTGTPLESGRAVLDWMILDAEATDAGMTGEERRLARRLLENLLARELQLEPTDRATLVTDDRLAADEVVGLVDRKLLNDPVIRDALAARLESLATDASFDDLAGLRKVHKLQGLLKQPPICPRWDPLDAWEEQFFGWREALPSEERDAWRQLTLHSFHSCTTKGSPSAAWLRKADKLVAAVGGEVFARHLQAWLEGPLPEEPSLGPLETFYGSARVLRSFLWMVPLLEAHNLEDALRDAHQRCVVATPRAGWSAKDAVHTMTNRKGRPRLASALEGLLGS
jgi:hypothetical protein